MNIWPKTQKAYGLLALAQGPSVVFNHPGAFNIVPRTEGDGFGLDIEVLLSVPIPLPCFARPCPRRPRHGFVESRGVHSTIEALTLFAEVLKVEPDAEMILMPRFTGKFSAVANNGGVVWGTGHDGVTNVGPGKTYFISAPCSREDWEAWVKRACMGGPRRSVKTSECHYIELVEHKGEVRAVQLRPGPLQYGGAEMDYIPREVKVERVITLNDVGFDLIKWDKLIRGARQGAVVCLPKGTTRFSHYAVHCLLNRVPIVFGRKVEVGEVLKPTGVAASTALRKRDYVYLACLILTQLLNPRVVTDGNGGSANASQDKWRVTTAIGTCHAMAGWGRDRHLLRLRAAGVSACFAYAASAAIGELRHFYRNGPGCGACNGLIKPKHTTAMNKVLDADAHRAFLHQEEVNRNPTYSRMSVLPVAVQISLLQQAAVDFKVPGWGGSFGGHRWAETAAQAAWLGRSLLSFCRKPDAARWARLQSRYNATLHCCHTHGKTLTKWVRPDVLNLGSTVPGLCFMNAVTAGLVFDDPALGELADLQKEFFTAPRAARRKVFTAAEKGNTDG